MMASSKSLTSQWHERKTDYNESSRRLERDDTTADSQSNGTTWNLLVITASDSDNVIS